MKHLLLLSILTIIGCVPYEQQVYTRYNRTLNESTPGETVINEVFYKNQYDFEVYNMQNGKATTLLALLPKNHVEKHDILLLDNWLLVPLYRPAPPRRPANVRPSVGYKPATENGKAYYLVWDGEYTLNDQNQPTVELIFAQSTPTKETTTFPSGYQKIHCYVITSDGTKVSVPCSSTSVVKQRPYVEYVSFDLSKIRHSHSNSISLRLLGLDGQMEYVYR